MPSHTKQDQMVDNIKCRYQHWNTLHCDKTLLIVIIFIFNTCTNQFNMLNEKKRFCWLWFVSKPLVQVALTAEITCFYKTGVSWPYAPISVGTCNLESLVASGHKKIWRSPAANMGFCDFKDVVAFGNNQLRRPLASKVKGPHSGLPKIMVTISSDHLFTNANLPESANKYFMVTQTT